MDPPKLVLLEILIIFLLEIQLTVDFCSKLHDVPNIYLQRFLKFQNSMKVMSKKYWTEK